MNNSIEILEDFIYKKKLLRQEHRLSYLIWEPTKKCNLSCLHCFNSSSPNIIEKDILTTQEVKNVLNDIYRAYDTTKITFAISGGEPLVREDIYEILSYATKLRYSVALTTNGMLIDKETIQKLIDSGLRNIAISIDGIKEKHNQLRGSTVSYDRALNALKMIKKYAPFMKTTIITCVNSMNIDTINLFIKEIAQYKPCIIRLVPFISSGRGLINKYLSLSKEQFIYLLNYTTKIRKDRDFFSNITFGNEGYYGPEFEMKVRDDFHYEHAGIHLASITYNGYVKGSTDISDEFIEGNIRKNSFVDIWENRFHRYREGKRDLYNPMCKDCIHWDLCEGGGFNLYEEYKILGECRYKFLFDS